MNENIIPNTTADVQIPLDTAQRQLEMEIMEMIWQDHIRRKMKQPTKLPRRTRNLLCIEICRTRDAAMATCNRPIAA